MFAPRARRLSLGTSLGGEDGLMSTILPDDLLITILAERLLVSSILLVFIIFYMFLFVSSRTFVLSLLPL